MIPCNPVLAINIPRIKCAKISNASNDDDTGHRLYHSHEIVLLLLAHKSEPCSLVKLTADEMTMAPPTITSMRTNTRGGVGIYKTYFSPTFPASAAASLFLILSSTTGCSSFSSQSSPRSRPFARPSSFARLRSSSVKIDTEDDDTAPLSETVPAPRPYEVMWTPDPEYASTTSMSQFMKEVGISATGSSRYDDLWRWSVENSDLFWSKLMDYLEVRSAGSTVPVRDGDVMPDVTYFPNATLNFAENLLRHGEGGSELRNEEAVVSISEGRDDVRWTFGELRDDASRIRAALEGLGVNSESAVGAYMSNLGEAIVAMLSTTSTGAVWSSCSPDFGPRAVADRFSQIEPSVLFVVDGYVQRGREYSMVDKVEELAAALPDLKRIVSVRVTEEDPEWRTDRVRDLVVTWDDFLESGSDGEDGSAPESTFAAVPFSHPQFVLYSSGTTGMPKSIAHGAGNVLLQHGKELILHSDLRPRDRMLFFTTCGWMMWNWMVSSLFAGAAVIAYDGFPAHPKLSSPWDLAERERITHMGTTPRFLQACRARVRPGIDNDLSNLRVLLSTGSPLLPEDYDYVYEHVKRSDLMLASISGGTDICSCFALGNPLLPVRRGEIQAFGLGLDVCARDLDTGACRVVGEKGELCCVSPFVAAPVKFFGDDEQKSRYRSSYFRDGADPGVWYHGDLVEVTGTAGASGGVIIHGRSDTTLKPGGVRIGTAEVYRFAETVDEVDDSLVIGDQIKTGKRAGDVRIVLFVKLSDGVTGLTDDLKKKIRDAIKTGASDSHVPALIREVEDIPYTKSGKKVEIAVRDLFAGEEPKNLGALRNLSVFDEYRAMAKEGL